MQSLDVEFKNISKRYRVRTETSANAGSRFRLRRSTSHDFWAVRNVSFQVPRGEALGIIGHNGAGKSTILKLLSGITTPSMGEIVIRGRLSALIEVGSGFHPELTGRENIFLSGSILGMRRRDIFRQFDSIVNFAEVEEFIDTPVKRYSSGMYVRLGFSIAAHLNPDILLLDEVLAVGDAAFQAKCLNRILELKSAGKSIVFISHDLQAVERLCDRVLLMQHGELVGEGAAVDMIAEYQRSTATFTPAQRPTDTTSDVVISGLSFAGGDGRGQFGFISGEPLRIRLSYKSSISLENAVFEVALSSQEGRLLCVLSTQNSGNRISLDQGSGVLEFYVPHLALLAGIYYLDVGVRDGDAPAGVFIDRQYRCATLSVNKGKEGRGELYMAHQWSLTGPAENARVQRIK